MPGQKYSARLINIEDGSVFRDIELKPGESLDLGEIRPTPTRGQDAP